jgi:hypothetical protein
MDRRRKHPIDAELLASWQARLILLRRRLAESPQAADAWFWKIQTEIIDYLLDRYCDKKTASQAVARVPIASPDLSRGLNPTRAEVNPSGSFPQASDSGKMPRSSGKIAPILQNIAQANLPRHEQLQRLDAQAKEALRLEGQDLRARMARIVALLDEHDLRHDPDTVALPSPSFVVTEIEQTLRDELLELLSLDAPPPSAVRDQADNETP